MSIDEVLKEFRELLSQYTGEVTTGHYNGKTQQKMESLLSQAEARGREERDKYWLKRMNNFERINKLPKDKIAGWSWLKTQISDLLTKLGDQNE